MKAIELENLTVDELVDRYAHICIAQDDALFHDEHRKFSRLFTQMIAVREELRRRGPEARLALKRLYDHPNLQVRLQAAKSIIGIDWEDALRVIQEVKKRGEMPQAGEAGMTLRALEKGIFKPD